MLLTIVGRSFPRSGS